jgi:predicted nucleotidyltransferase
VSFAASTPAEIVAAVLAVMQPRADACGASLLVVGAAARDLLLATPSARATNDVDVAIAVESAAQIADVMAGLERDPSFAGRYRVDGIVVDVVPFGEWRTATGQSRRRQAFG